MAGSTHGSSASGRALSLSGPLMDDDLPTSDILFQADTMPQSQACEFGRQKGAPQ